MNISPFLCNTGQQKDLLASHLTQFSIKPDYQLDVMRCGQSLNRLLAQLTRQLPAIYDHCRPHIVILQGDTASALAAAMVAHGKGLPIAHIEAGLRTHDRACPFPEEIYRQSISTLAKWHFCPTDTAQQNLLREGIGEENIFVTGNTSVDMALKIHIKSEKNGPNLSLEQAINKPYFLITLHRRESQGAPLTRIVNCLLAFAKGRPEFNFIIPLHPNPATTRMIREKMADQQNIFLIAPQPYPDFIHLMADAFAIITDSGGIQEEAPTLNTPVVVVRDKTERAEGVTNGCLRLAGTSGDTILKELNLLIDDKTHYKRMQEAPNPFGDGFAARRITAHLKNILESDPLFNVD
ncbi:UDP-N-acetylglucosamine 2-epimerase [hydrothermal vent metagenome]|uniref:UDP-N-acetylglucosamine 2-epimerase (non-hydrolyzing) n=1 Tax=hydrothermal vent metagenome TaxID=652676 RepID=A0A3B0SM95_9ZZZZ